MCKAFEPLGRQRSTSNAHNAARYEISVRETYINGALKRPISLGHLGGPRYTASLDHLVGDGEQLVRDF